MNFNFKINYFIRVALVSFFLIHSSAAMACFGRCKGDEDCQQKDVLMALGINNSGEAEKVKCVDNTENDAAIRPYCCKKMSNESSIPSASN